MNKLRAILSLSVAVSLGTVFGSCTSFSSDNPTSGSGGSSATGSGGDTSTGSGGDTSTGSGGSSASGGTTGSGGATASGGTTGSGGATASGGTTGSGGATGTGGATASGGTTGSGGATASGGATGTGGAAGATGTGGAKGGTTGTGGGAAGAPGTGGTASGGTTGSGGTTATGGTTGTGGTTVAATPCSILAAAGNTCVAAHSTVRVIYPSYTGPLYQVCKGTAGAGPNSCTSGTTKDIGSVGGYADSAAQDTFCSGGTCTHLDHLRPVADEERSQARALRRCQGQLRTTRPPPPLSRRRSTATTVYGVLIKPTMGYRAGCTGCGVVTPKGTATGDEAETEYMVTSQNNLVDGCCFDYGNAETDSHDDGNGTMEAVYFGGGVVWGTGSPGGHTNGPWVMADLENGLYAGWENNQDQNISTNTPSKFDFVTAVVVGDTPDTERGEGPLCALWRRCDVRHPPTMYDGIRPAKTGTSPCRNRGPSSSESAATTATVTEGSGSKASWRAVLRRWRPSTPSRPTSSLPATASRLVSTSLRRSFRQRGTDS